MQAYATLAEFNRQGYKANAKDELSHDEFLSRASRFVDAQIGVPPGYFLPAPAQAEARTFVGDGTAYLRVGEVVRGSITFVDCFRSAAPDYVDQGGYLIAIDGVWCGAVEVTARYGFAEIPDDIIAATLEIAVAMWRGRDSAYAKVVTDANGGQTVYESVPARAKAIIEARRKERPPVFA